MKKGFMRYLVLTLALFIATALVLNIKISTFASSTIEIEDLDVDGLRAGYYGSEVSQVTTNSFVITSTGHSVADSTSSSNPPIKLRTFGGVNFGNTTDDEIILSFNYQITTSTVDDDQYEISFNGTPEQSTGGNFIINLPANDYLSISIDSPHGDNNSVIVSFTNITVQKRYSIELSDSSVNLEARVGYKGLTDSGLEEGAIHKDIIATSTGYENTTFILGGFKDSSDYEKFGLIVGGLEATVAPKEGLAPGTYTATIVIEDFNDNFDPIEVPVTFVVRPNIAPIPDTSTK